MGRDLGTYWVRVEFWDGRGFLYEWSTSARYCMGTDGIKPLDAQRISPAWEDEQDVIDSIHYIFTEGNYACDCNRSLFLARAHQQYDTDMECGETLRLKKLSVIGPSGNVVVEWDNLEAEIRGVGE